MHRKIIVFLSVFTNISKYIYNIVVDLNCSSEVESLKKNFNSIELNYLE